MPKTIVNRTLGSCNSAQNCPALDKSIQGLGYCCMLPRCYTMFARRLARKEVPFNVARRRLLKRYGQNYVFFFSRRKECQDLSLIAYCGHGPSFESSSGRMQVVSRKELVLVQRMNEEKGKEKKCLCCFKNIVPTDIYYAFLDNHTPSDNDYVLKQIKMQLASIDGLVAIVLTCSKQTKIVVGKSRKPMRACSEAIQPNP